MFGGWRLSFGVRCLLVVVCCFLFVVCPLKFIAVCWLMILLFSVCCLLFVGCFVVGHCVRFVVCVMCSAL